MMMLASAILALAASAAGEEKPGHELLFADIPAPVCWSQTECEPAVKVYKGDTVALGKGHFAAAGMAHTMMGQGHIVTGGWAHTVMGLENEVKASTAATAMGTKTTAGGYAATATGQKTYAMGWASLSTGIDTVAFGDMTVTMGNGTLAKGVSSVSMGHKTKAESFAEVVIGQYNEVNPIGECDQFGPGKPYPGPAPEGCASRGWPERLEGFEMDINGTMVTVPAAWQGYDAVFRVGVGTGESDRKDAITVYKNGTVVIGDLRTPGPGRRLSASDGALEKKLEATEKKLAALEAAVMALTRNP